MKKIFYGLLILLILGLGIFSLNIYYSNPNISSGNLKSQQVSKKADGKKENKKNNKKSNKKEEQVYRTKIWATGDIMYHMPLYKNSYNMEKQEYDFTSYYQKVKEYLDGADIVAGNLETSINPNKQLSGFPLFNTPPEAIKYLKESGFDILSTVNNHCLDTGLEGISTTIDAIDANGLKHFGTYKDAKRDPVIIESNNIKVGFIGYSDIFNGMDSLVSGNEFMISPLKEDLIIEDISKLKNAGVDYIIAYPHWGIEYSKIPDEKQKYFEDFMIKNGVDAILGSHPHVLQETSYKQVNGKNIFTIYSMGNSISNQKKRWIGRDGVESGVFVELNLVKEDGKTKLENYNLFPTYVNSYIDEKGIRKSEVVLYYDILEGGKYRDNLTSESKNFVDNEYEKVLQTLNGKKEEPAS